MLKVVIELPQLTHREDKELVDKVISIKRQAARGSVLERRLAA